MNDEMPEGVVSNKYLRVYEALIDKRRKFPLDKRNGCYEEHHVIPHCMGGKDEKSNLVVLTPREHYVAHLLLCRVYAGSIYFQKLASAVIYMVAPRFRFKGRKSIRFSSRLYEMIRIAFAKSKIGWYGRLTQEQRADLGEKISHRFKGVRLSDEHRKNISLGCRGKKMPMSQCLATSKRMKIRMADYRRKVVCIETGVVYESILAAEKDNPTCPTISRCCRGKNATSGGLHFRFFDNVLDGSFAKKQLIPKSEINRPIRKGVYCVEFDMTFRSLTECSNEVAKRGFLNSRGQRIMPYSIRNVANGKLKDCGGLHFQWVK